MASDYVTRFRADTSQHDAAIKSSTGVMKSFDQSVKGAQSRIKELGNRAKGAYHDIAALGFDKLRNSLGSFGDILVNNVAGNLGKVKVAAGGATTGVAGFSAAATAALPAIAALAAGYTALSKTARLETNLDNLQALTGLTGEGMQVISDQAIRMSKVFGESAGDIVDSMGLIGSQFPALLENSYALAKVSESALVLAKSGGISVVDAAKGITTVLNQMGVAATEVDGIINVLAAGSQQGAAEIGYLNVALEKSGTAFASANMSYVQAVAAIETIAPKFSSADVAGSKLASTLLRLSIQGNNDFKPAVVGMSKALDNLAAAGMSDSEMLKLVGAENITMLKTLIQQRDTYNELTESLSGTNTAYDQMAIKMDNVQSLVNKLKKAWDAFWLTLGQSEIFQDLLTGFKALLRGLTTFVNGAGQLMSPLMRIFDSLWRVIKSLIGVFSPLLDIIKALEFAFSGVVWLLEKAANLIQSLCNVVVSFINTVARGIKTLWNNIKSFIQDTALWRGVQKLRNLFGGASVDTSNADKLNNALREVKISPVRIDTNFEAPDMSTIGGGEVKSGALKGTIDWYQEALKKIDDELQGTIVSEGRLKELLAEKAKLSEELLALQIKYGLEKKHEKETEENSVKVSINPDSYRGISQALSELNDQLDLEVYGSEKYWELVKSIKELTDKKLEIELKMDDDLLSDADKKLKAINESMKRTEQIGTDSASVITSLGRIFTDLGNKGDDANSKIYQSIGMVANAIAEMIPHIMTIITAKQAEAMASGVAGAAKLPYPANLPAMFSIVGILGSLFASLPKFADGGIIKGAASIGDYNIARVNSGEMILNGSQQAKLFNLLNTGGDLGNSGGESQVTFVLEGEKLIGLMNNYNRKRGRIR